MYLDVAIQLRWTALLVPLGGRVDGGVGGKAIWRLLQPHGLGGTGEINSQTWSTGLYFLFFSYSWLNALMFKKKPGLAGLTSTVLSGLAARGITCATMTSDNSSVFESA